MSPCSSLTAAALRAFQGGHICGGAAQRLSTRHAGQEELRLSIISQGSSVLVRARPARPCHLLPDSPGGRLPPRPSRTWRSGLRAHDLCGENLISGLAGDSDLQAERAHLVAIGQAGNKAQGFAHNRTLFSMASTLPPGKTTEKVLPMCPVRTVTLSQFGHVTD